MSGLEEPKENVLTRSARRKAGLPPPTPLFRGLSSKFVKKEDITLETRLKPSLGKSARPKQDDSGCDSDSSDDEQIVWVQCDNKDCQKWRKLPPNCGADLTREWYCHMHPDPIYQSCDTPEEKWRVSKKRAFTFSRLHPGQLIWAKMRGYPPWPAIVSHDPWSHGGCEYICEEREGCIYHVEFLGKPRTHTWIPEEQVEPYHNDYSCSLGVIRQSKKLRFALHEAESFLTLSNEQHLEKCEYQKNTITEAAPQKRKHDSLISTKSKKRGRPSGKSSVKKEPFSDTTNNQVLHSAPRQSSNTTKNQDLHSTTRKPQEAKAPVPSLFGSVGNTEGGLTSHVNLLQCLGIPLTQGNMFNMAGIMLQNSLLQSLQSQMKYNDIRPALKTNQDPSIPPEGQQQPTSIPTKSARVTFVSNSPQVPIDLCSHLQKAQKPPSIAQNQQVVFQGLIGNKTVQLTKGKRKKSNGTVSKKKTQKNSSTTKWVPVQNEIQKYFKLPSPVKDQECGGRSLDQTDINGIITAQSSVKDQLVPEGPGEITAAPGLEASLAPSVVHLESEAQSEMMEIEEMISLFGSDTPCVSSREPPTMESGVKDASTLPESGLLDLDIDSMLNEMSQIEGLIEDLSKD